MQEKKDNYLTKEKKYLTNMQIFLPLCMFPICHYGIITAILYDSHFQSIEIFSNSAIFIVAYELTHI